MMRGMVLDSSSPLYGRAKEILKLTPMEIYWLKELLNIDAVRAVEEYSVWGGIPRYWELRAAYNSFEEAIKNLVLNPLGILHEEPIRLFLDEMRTAVQPLGILTTIADGSNRASEISGRLEKPLTQLMRPLQQLIELNFIRREIPYGENEKSTKKSLYKIDDPFMNFYFKYISLNRLLLGMRRFNLVEQKLKKTFPVYVTLFYEHLCRLSLSKMNIKGFEISEAKRWWGNNIIRKIMEMDIVAETNDKKYIIAGEVKWADKLNEEAELNNLIQKSQLLPFLKDIEVIPCLFTNRKTGTNYKKCYVFDADDVID